MPGSPYTAIYTHLHTTYNKAERNLHIMTGLQDMDAKLIRQYSSAYGSFASGDYAIGDTIAVPGTSGEVIWSYQSAQGLVYVVDDDSSGFPTEVLANQVHGRGSPWQEE